MGMDVGTMDICIDIATTSCHDVVQKLNNSKKDAVILIVGEMGIEYVGRASSYAYPAHRLLIVKPDGSLLVHESTRVEPLNWQPPRSIVRFECVGDKLRVKSIRNNPHEEVIIDFIYIEFIKLCNLSSTRLSIIGRESDVVRSILSNPSIVEEGASIVGVDITTVYGKIDILLRKGERLIVVEVKNEKAGIPAVVQLKRYVEYYVGRGCKVEGVLIAPDVSQEALTMLTREGFKYIDFHTLKNKTKKKPTLEKFINISKD